MAVLYLLEAEWGMTTLAQFPISLNHSRLCLTSVMFELMTKTPLKAQNECWQIGTPL